MEQFLPIKTKGKGLKNLQTYTCTELHMIALVLHYECIRDKHPTQNGVGEVVYVVLWSYYMCILLMHSYVNEVNQLTNVLYAKYALHAHNAIRSLTPQVE